MNNEDVKWIKLKEYIISEKNKIQNSDDIPQSIYKDILIKMDELDS